MGIPFEKIVKEDLNLGYGTTSVSMPGGGSATGNKVGLHTLAHVYNVQSFGAVGDGSADDTTAFEDAIAQARTDKLGVYVPSGVYKIARQLTISGVDLVGASTGDHNSLVEGAIFPIFKPTAGFSRLFLVGPPTSADGLAGYSDHTRLENIAMDLSDADTGFTAIGSDYGCMFRVFRNLHIRGVSGQSAAKAFTGIKLYSPNSSTYTNAYNLLENIRILHCDHAYDLSSAFANFCNANTLVACHAWDATKFYSVCGLHNKFINCGAYSFYAGWTPGPTTAWVIKAITGTNAQGTECNHFDGFYIESITSIARPFFYITDQTIITNLRGVLTFGMPITEGGAPDYYQIVDATGAVQGPLATHGPTLITGNTVRAANICSPNLHQNRVPNGNFNAWPNGTTFATPADSTPVMQGFTALKGGATDYTIARILQPDALTHDQAVRLTVVDNATGITGFQIQLSDHYPAVGLQYLGAQMATVQQVQGGRICVGALVRCGSVQAELDGVYLSMHSGSIAYSLTEVLRYDGTNTFGSLKQQAGGWMPIFINAQVPATATQMLLKVGLNNDGSHAGIGVMDIQSLFLYPGWHDWYSIWNMLQPRGTDAWAGSKLYAVSDKTFAWTPGLIASGAVEDKNVTVSDARLGDQAIVDYDQDLGAGLSISGKVTNNSGNVRLQIQNLSGGNVTPPAGNAIVSILRRSIS